MSSGLHAKYPLFLCDFMKLEFYQQLIKKYSNVKFHKNPSSGSMLFLLTKQIGAFHTFAVVPKNIQVSS